MLDPAFEYQQIREEIRAEHALIANRLTWYVTSQSFLVTAFAISQANGFTWHRWFSTTLLPLVAFVSSVLVFPSIVGACHTIQLWRRKQKAFMARHTKFEEAFALHRARWVEAQGFVFPIVIPLVFAAFWVVVHVASYAP